MFKLCMLLLCVLVCSTQAYNVWQDEDYADLFRTGVEGAIRDTTKTFLKAQNLPASPDRARDQSVVAITKVLPQLSAEKRAQLVLLQKIVPSVWW